MFMKGGREKIWPPKAAEFFILCWNSCKKWGFFIFQGDSKKNLGAPLAAGFFLAVGQNL